MPIYEYQCQRCSEIAEVFLRSGEKEPKKCDVCAGKLKRLISHSGFQLKGTGWYVTDYARKGKSDPAASESAGGPSGTASKPASDAKPSAASDAKPSADTASPAAPKTEEKKK